MEKEILYEVEIEYPTNSGSYSRKRIFKTREAAEEYLEANKDEDAEEVSPNEWWATGPNWKVLKMFEGGWTVVTLMEIQNFDEDVDSQDTTEYNKDEKQ